MNSIDEYLLGSYESMIVNLSKEEIHELGKETRLSMILTGLAMVAGSINRLTDTIIEERTKDVQSRSNKTY